MMETVKSFSKSSKRSAIIFTRQCCALNALRNPHRYLDKISLRKREKFFERNPFGNIERALFIKIGHRTILFLEKHLLVLSLIC